MTSQESQILPANNACAITHAPNLRSTLPDRNGIPSIDTGQPLWGEGRCLCFTRCYFAARLFLGLVPRAISFGKTAAVLAR